MENWTWETFNGNIVTATTIDHQHASNILWYHKIVCGHLNGLEHIKEILETRFNGQLLPYKPHVKFQGEIEILRKKRMLQNCTKFGGDIYLEDIKIGEYQYPNNIDFI